MLRLNSGDHRAAGFSSCPSQFVTLIHTERRIEQLPRTKTQYGCDGTILAY